ncbi:MAG TPA: glycoside hydrolase family 32 protein [Ktedonobacteraceae bacterium]|nr:glycoside hydrolase family 32 protein [Ktedonobacteraceae bacterium]
MHDKELKDYQRTTYHFQPPSYWMNDPNGLVHWKGVYHLFYQYNPYGPLHGAIHWGHATSPDLLHWTHLPIALTPTKGGPDEDGCWSGCFVDRQGTPTLIYSGNVRDRQLPCLASSTDDLLTWQKYAGNPVIPDWPPDLDLTGFRDHCVWQERDQWYQLIGSGIQDVGGTALLYRSPDLLHWEYLQPLCIGNKDEHGTMWECPDFFPLGEKYVLVVSSIPHGRVYYFIGRYEHFTFTWEHHGILDESTSFYAPQSLRDEQGRRIQFGWLREGRSEAALQAAGWAGVMSLPRVLSLRADHTLSIEPATELTRLRQQQHHIAPQLLARYSLVSASVSSRSLEILLEVEYDAESHCGLSIQDQSHPDECLEISLSPAGLRVEQRQEDQHTTKGCWLEPGHHRLHIFIDGSVLEIFIDERTCLTERFYHSAPEQLKVSVFSHQGEARLHQLEIWEL